MSDISLHTDGASSVTRVSNMFIDHYMAEANGEYVKIYLYLLRCLGRNDIDFSISTIAQHLGHTDLDVKRALQYWEARHLLRLEYDWNQNLVGICLVDVPASAPVTTTVSAAPVQTVAPVQPTAPVIQNTVVAPSRPTSKSYSPEELLMFNENQVVKDLLMLAQCYSGKQLTQNDMNTIVFWYDGLSMSPELIEFLINYCASNGHTRLSYMNKIALSWADQGITTLPQAELNVAQHSDSYRAVVTNLGLGSRSLNPAELSFLNTWTKEYGFSSDLIGEACSRAKLRGTNAPMKYAHRILEGWHKSGVKTMKDVEAADLEYANNMAAQKTVAATNVTRNQKIHDFEERTDNDWEAFELKMLQKK